MAIKTSDTLLPLLKAIIREIEERRIVEATFRMDRPLEECPLIYGAGWRVREGSPRILTINYRQK